MTRISLNETLTVSAVRYALGRQTYVVAETVEEILRVWPELSPGTRGIIQRDIALSAADFTDLDRREWDRIRQLR